MISMIISIVSKEKRRDSQSSFCLYGNQYIFGFWLLTDSQDVWFKKNNNNDKNNNN